MPFFYTGWAMQEETPILYEVAKFRAASTLIFVVSDLLATVLARWIYESW
jgi:hypothetical protein